MKQLRLSTLSLCYLTAIMSSSVFAEEIKPLLQEGKTTLYQQYYQGNQKADHQSGAAGYAAGGRSGRLSQRKQGG